MNGVRALAFHNLHTDERLHVQYWHNGQYDRQAWLQINHPGRQVFAAMGQEAVAPSAVGVDMGSYSHLFPVPFLMRGNELKPLTPHAIPICGAQKVRVAHEPGFR